MENTHTPRVSIYSCFSLSLPVLGSLSLSHRWDIRSYDSSSRLDYPTSSLERRAKQTFEFSVTPVIGWLDRSQRKSLAGRSLTFVQYDIHWCITLPFAVLCKIVKWLSICSMFSLLWKLKLIIGAFHLPFDVVHLAVLITSVQSIEPIWFVRLSYYTTFDIFLLSHWWVDVIRVILDVSASDAMWSHIVIFPVIVDVHACPLIAREQRIRLDRILFA